MNREEAINFANCLKNNYTVDLNDMEAFCDMAIKALEQEPTTKNNLGVDCISRDNVCRYIAEFVNHEFSTREEEELIDNIITGIERMPSVTPQLSVPEVTALAEWTEKLTKECEEAYNKGFKDGIKGSIPKADYENRLKADLKAILVELQLEIEELDSRAGYDGNGMPTFSTDYIRKNKVNELIQQKVDKLKEAKDGNEH